MLFALDKLALVGSAWVFQSAKPIKFVALESARVFEFLFASNPGQSAISFVSFIILAFVGMVGSFLFALPVELVIFEVSFIF